MIFKFYLRGLNGKLKMSSKTEPDLDKIFEKILSEIKEGERDEAAMLQAIALSNSDPSEIRKNYLLIRSNKIHKEKQLKNNDKKNAAKLERMNENRKSIKIILYWLGFIALCGLMFKASAFL